MKIINKVLKFLFLLIVFFISGCNEVNEYVQLQNALENTINEIQENYDLNNVTEDLPFISTDENNYYYFWNSSNQQVISNFGEVNRQITDVEVVITVRVYDALTEASIYYEDSFSCVVIKLESDGYTFDIAGTKSFLNVYNLNEVEEDGEYNNYLDVVAYIYYFHKLPNNYLTKSQAKQLGWRGSGNVWVNEALKGKNIGGDTFKNYEMRLPVTDSDTYIEVDVNCSNGTRGMYRIVYNRYTFDIYYTDDHYGTFTYMIGELK